MEHWVLEIMIEKIKTILLIFFDFSKITQEYYLSHPPSSPLEKKIHTFSHANHVLSSFSYFLNDETIHQNYQYIKKNRHPMFNMVCNMCSSPIKSVLIRTCKRYMHQYNHV